MPPAPPPAQTPITVGYGATYSAKGPAANNFTLSGLGADTITGGDMDTVSLGGGMDTISLHDQANVSITGGNDNVTVHDNAAVTIYGGGNTVSMHDNGSLTINDSRTETSGFSGAVLFGDNITTHNGGVINLNYSLTLGNSDVVTVGWNGSLSAGGPTTVTNTNVLNAGKGDVITFATSSINVTLNAGSGDTVSTTGTYDTITMGGTAATKSSLTIGATAAGTTINGGLGTDTFTGGAGYDGGNHYVGSAQSNAAGFQAIGSCANYANLACKVTVNYNTNVGQGFDAGGNLLWTDTYTNVQQVKAGQLDGNVLTGSNAYFCELKGGNGSTTFHGGAAGDRIIWSSAGATGAMDGQSTDMAVGGSGADEYYWRNQPGGKGVSNFGETINGFNAAKGDDLNLSEYATAGFNGVSNAFTFSDLSNWVSVGLANGNRDSVLYFDPTGTGNFNTIAATLKNDNLYTDYGVSTSAAGSGLVAGTLGLVGSLLSGGSVGSPPSAAASQQLVQAMYNSGSLVLTQPH